MKKIKIVLISLLAAAFIFSSAPMVQASTIPVAPAIFETSLSFPIATTDTSMTLVSNTLLGGGALPSSYTCFTVDQGQPNTEYMCGTVSGTTVSNLIRGIDPLTGNSSDSNLIFSHRRGADVKITDFPILTVLRNILNGADTLPGPINYAAGINPVGNQDLATKAYVLSVVSGGPVSLTSLTVPGVAGSTVASGNLLYLDTSGKWDPVSASTASNVNNVTFGIAQGAGTSGNSIANGVLIQGLDTAHTGTAGTIVYASNTAGALSTSPGTNERAVGEYVASSAGMYFDPDFFYIPTANQKAAMQGGGSFGTPSATNEFVTPTYLGNQSNPTLQILTSSGTYNTPAGLKYAVVEGVGGGGGGQGSNSGTGVGGSGGGGGGYCKLVISAATMGSSQTITIGAGGAGGSGGSSGSAGGNTSLGSFFTAGGGNGGTTNIGGTGGTTIGGTNVFCFNGQGGGGGSTGSGVPSGMGGSSVFGGGGAGRRTTGAGIAGGQYGGGGGGAFDSGSANPAGGTGASGVIIVTQYFY